MQHLPSRLGSIDGMRRPKITCPHKLEQLGVTMRLLTGHDGNNKRKSWPIDAHRILFETRASRRPTGHVPLAATVLQQARIGSLRMP